MHLLSLPGSKNLQKDDNSKSEGLEIFIKLESKSDTTIYLNITQTNLNATKQQIKLMKHQAKEQEEQLLEEFENDPLMQQVRRERQLIRERLRKSKRRMEIE